MDRKTWFILANEKISGPVAASQILTELTEGKWFDSRFWTKGKPHWMTADQFRNEMQHQEAQNRASSDQNTKWFLKIHHTEYGPMSYPDLVEYLSQKPNYKNIYVYQESLGEWKEVYQVEILMEKLGVNRRHHPRVPIEGSISIIDGFLKGKKALLFSLSQGGLGTKDLKGVSLGEKIKGVLHSPNILTPIHFQGDVVAIYPEGGFGLKFTQISAEGSSQIIAYIKQFVESHPNVDFQKIA